MSKYFEPATFWGLKNSSLTLNLPRFLVKQKLKSLSQLLRKVLLFAFLVKGAKKMFRFAQKMSDKNYNI